MDDSPPLDEGDAQALEALAYPEFDTAPLERADAMALIEGFLRLRQAEKRGWTEVEYLAVIEWGRRTRLDQDLLGLLRQGLLGLDFSGPELLFTSPPALADVQAVELIIAVGDDGDGDAVLVALAATMWADGGRMPSAEQQQQVVAWVRTARANSALLDALLLCPHPSLDYDSRGRMVFYPPERLA